LAELVGGAKPGAKQRALIKSLWLKRRRHAQNAQKSRLAPKNLRHLRPPFLLAQKMGKSVGRGKVLQRPMPGAQSAAGLTAKKPFY
jgi:hypothetical protein